MGSWNTKEQAGILLLIDFEKGLDTIEWGYIKSDLKAYIFGDVVLRWFQKHFTKKQKDVL